METDITVEMLNLLLSRLNLETANKVQLATTLKTHIKGIWPMQLFVNDRESPTCLVFKSKDIFSLEDPKVATAAALFSYAKNINDFVTVFEAARNSMSESDNKSIFCSFLANTFEVVKPYLDTKYRLISSHSHNTEGHFHLCYIDKDNFNAETLNYTLPDGFYMDKIHKSEAEQLAKHWQYGEAPKGTLRYFNEMLKSQFKTVALRDSTSALVSYYMHVSLGSLGKLYTVPEYRGRGFGKIVTKEITKQLLNEDLVPFCFVDVCLPYSIAVHKACGYNTDMKITFFVAEQLENISKKDKPNSDLE